VVGDEAAADPNVRALAARAQRVLAVTMFLRPVHGWADLVLPGTSYLERDGTYVNLEGRIQRLRRAVIPPAPAEVPLGEYTVSPIEYAPADGKVLLPMCAACTALAANVSDARSRWPGG